MAGLVRVVAGQVGLAVFADDLTRLVDQDRRVETTFAPRLLC